jgi:hypothetical protein
LLGFVEVEVKPVTPWSSPTKEEIKRRGGVSTIDCDGRCISSVGEDGDVTKIWMSRHGKP